LSWSKGLVWMDPADQSAEWRAELLLACRVVSTDFDGVIGHYAVATIENRLTKVIAFLLTTCGHRWC